MYCFCKEFLLKNIAIKDYRIHIEEHMEKFLPEGVKTLNDFESFYQKNVANQVSEK